jgi:hypothetical protein
MSYLFLLFAAILLVGMIWGAGYRLRAYEQSRPKYQARVWYTADERGRLRRYSVTPPGCHYTDEEAIHLNVIPEEADVKIHLAALADAQRWADFYTERATGWRSRNAR